MNTNVDLFNAYDEQITELLENYVLSRTVFRSLDGGNKKWDMSQRPIDKFGRYIWYVGPKSNIDRHMFDYSDLKIILDKFCNMHIFFRAKLFIKNENGFNEFLQSNGLVLKSEKDEDGLEIDNKCLVIKEVSLLSEFLTFTV